MDREKTQIQPLLCAADRNAAVHGLKLAAVGAAAGTLPWSDMDNTDQAYLPTVGRWGCEWPRGSKSGGSGICNRHGDAVLPSGDFAPENGVLNNNTIHSGVPFAGYDLLDELVGATQVGGPWLADHPLPLPVWAPQPKKALKVPTIWQYEELVSQIELQVQKLLEEHNYNTVGNFLAFYRAFKNSGCYSLKEFFRSYSPPITPQHHTCVGLALELWKRLLQLDQRFPGLTDHLYLVSCEENIETVDDYAMLGDRLDAVANSLEKEHVLLALRVQVAGRPGVLLCDPGYHVGRVITVMMDCLYPHTGWFIQSRESNSQKNYNYAYSLQNNNFVEWTEHNITANGIQITNTALIYVSRPYLTAVDVTERRNLAYNFRSLLSRDQKGHVLAGIYFKIKESHDEFTVFYQDGGAKKRLKYNFAAFLHPEKVDSSTKEIVLKCSVQLNLSEGALQSILSSLAEVFADKSFITQILEVNENINDMAEDN